MVVARGDLTDRQWALIEPLLPVNGGRGGQWRDHRQVINGILYRLRTGIPWRDVPERYGPHSTLSERHRQWSADGTWDRLVREIQSVADAGGDIDWDASVDSTSVRAHQHAAGAPQAAPRPVSGKKGARRRTNRAGHEGLDAWSQAVVERAARRLAGHAED